MNTGNLQQRASRALNYDLFGRIGNHFNGSSSKSNGDSELPAVASLYQLFDRFNFLYFKGMLPPPKIEYSNRLTCAGSYNLDLRIIKISRKYHRLFPEEIEDTLKHEMIHLLHYKHNAAFKTEAKRIGASLMAKTHPSLRRQPKYLYTCPACGLEYPRQKRLHMSSCGDCSENKKYDEHFKLKLLKSFKSSGNPT